MHYWQNSKLLSSCGWTFWQKLKANLYSWKNWMFTIYLLSLFLKKNDRMAIFFLQNALGRDYNNFSCYFFLRKLVNIANNRRSWTRNQFSTVHGRNFLSIFILFFLVQNSTMKDKTITYMQYTKISSANRSGDLRGSIRSRP